MTDPDVTIPTEDYQLFSLDGERMQRICAYIVGKTSELFVYWSDIQGVFPNVDHLKDMKGERVLFEFDDGGTNL